MPWWTHQNNVFWGKKDQQQCHCQHATDILLCNVRSAACLVLPVQTRTKDTGIWAQDLPFSRIYCRIYCVIPDLHPFLFNRLPPFFNIVIVKFGIPSCTMAKYRPWLLGKWFGQFTVNKYHKFSRNSLCTLRDII